MSRLAGMLSFLLVLAWGAGRPPLPAPRFTRLRRVPDPPGCDERAPRPHGERLQSHLGRVELSATIGRRLRRVARRPDDGPEGHTDRIVGRVALLAAAAGAMGGPVVGVAIVLTCWCTVVARHRAARRRHESAVLDELPDIVDLFRLTTAAGLNLRWSVEAVARHGDGVVAEAMGAAAARCARGDRLVAALDTVAAVGEPVRPIVDALLAAERYGTPLAPALDRLADGCRQQRRRRHEEAARSAPVKLLFPLVFCTLPALGLLTVVPVLVRSWPSLVS
jgi:Flp pilus assembly protein TadB